MSHKKAVAALLYLSCVWTLAAACGPQADQQIVDRFAPWQSVTGAPVPSKAPIYVTGIDSVGQASVWVTESWITRGHSHTGLFRSGDGGMTWQQTLGWDGWPLWQKYFDSANVLLVAQFEEGYRLHSRLLRTHDGGQHWSAADLPSGLLNGWDRQPVYFVDPSNGWLMTGVGSSSISSCAPPKEGVAVYRTQDGGASWSQVVRVDEQHPLQNGLRVDGVKVGLSFRSATSGYIATSDAMDGHSVYVTNDGGNSWQVQSMPVAASSQASVVIAPPDWVTSNFGLMGVNIGPRSRAACTSRTPSPQPSPSAHPWDVEPPASIVVPRPGSLLLVTTDGGRRWSAVTPTKGWGGIAGKYATAGEANWWVPSGADLWATADGGRTWQGHTAVLKPGCDFGILHFDDPMAGVASALCDNPGPVIAGCAGQGDYVSEWDCPPVSLPLLMTRDGGRTWAEMAKPTFNDAG